jgi:hypothetical protein
VKTYLGRGETAQRAARQVAQRREARLAAREAMQAEQVRLAAADYALEEALQLIEQLMLATLLAAGYHIHRGCWRRRRTHGQEG